MLIGQRFPRPALTNYEHELESRLQKLFGTVFFRGLMLNKTCLPGMKYAVIGYFFRPSVSVSVGYVGC